MICLNCGLKTRALKHCVYCKQRPDTTTAYTPFYLSFPQKTRKLMFSELSVSSVDCPSDESIPQRNGCSEQWFQIDCNDVPLDLSSTVSPNKASICSTKQSDVGSLPLKPMNGQHFPQKSVTKKVKSKADKAVSGLTSALIPMDWMSLPIGLSVNYMRFGTYISSGHFIQLSLDVLRLIGVYANTTDNTFKFDITLPFSQIIHLKYCSDPTIPLIIIKVNHILAKTIQKCLNVGHDSDNGLVFDINSNDPKQQIIVLNLRQNIDKMLVSLLSGVSKQTNISFDLIQIDTKEAKDILLFKTILPIL